jgi:ribokinase
MVVIITPKNIQGPPLWFLTCPHDKETGAGSMSVLVFGSINMDLTTYTPRLPRVGETIFGSGYGLSPGGKGANQAVAAARLGAQTSFVGRIGDDDFGSQALAALAAEGIDTSSVLVDPEHATGLAVISVDQQADNAIVVISGANMTLTHDDASRARAALSDAKVLLLQLEVPFAASFKLAELARQQGVQVVLDPAPAEPLSDDMLAAVDILTPNESEAGALVGFPVDSTDSAQRAAGHLRERGVGTVIIKMGELGAYFDSEGDSGFQPIFKVKAIDTVAAGDAFNGGVAVALNEAMELSEAVRWGAAAGALATTRRGAIGAMPTREQLQALLDSGSDSG